MFELFNAKTVPPKLFLATMLSLAFFAWLMLDARWSGLFVAAGQLTPTVIGMALLGLFSTYLLRALRVFYEFRDAARGRFATCLRIVLFHNALVNVVPMRGGELAFPLLLRRSLGISTEKAVVSLLWLRLQDAFILLGLAILVWPGLQVWARLIGVMGLVLLALALPMLASRLGVRSTNKSSGWRSRLEKMRVALAESARHARIGWLWTLANWSIKLAVQAWLLAQILSAPLAAAIAGALGAELAAIFPIQGVAGFGSYEAGAAAAMLGQGIIFSDGLQAALVLHLCILASALASALSAATLVWLISIFARDSGQQTATANSKD